MELFQYPSGQNPQDSSGKIYQVLSQIENFKIPIGLILVGVVLVIGGLLNSPKPHKEFPKQSLISASDNKIKINISGAVYNPGVYELEENSRVEDVINAAGGITEEVNISYLEKSLNLAQKVSDGIKIYIPYKNETTISNSNTAVNLNNATQAQLESLTGIGPVTAAKIISNRPYQKIEELLSKKVTGKSTFEKIKNQITVF